MKDHFDLVSFQKAMLKESARQEILACNSISQRFGLRLMEQEVEELLECRSKALKDTGRIEFCGGILPKLIFAFCDSPYMEAEEYATNLAQLQEVFYYFKSESMDYYTDDEIIEGMVSVFHGRAQGSTEYLMGISVDALIRYARDGFNPYNGEEAGDLF